MKVILNSTNTKAFAVGNAAAVQLAINPIESGYNLMVRVSGMAHMDFETDATLEGIQAKAAIILAALEED